MDENQLFNEIVKLVRRLASGGDLPKGLTDAPLAATTQLDQLGLDSMAKVSLVSAFDHYLGIYVDAETIPEDESLGALAQRLAKHRK